MKKILIFLFLFVLIISVVGCGAKQKIGEAITEGMIENASGGEIDIDGDEIKITGEDGEEFLLGVDKWPKTDLMKNVPEFKEGKIIGTMDMNDAVQVNIEEVKEKSFSKYLDEIKKSFTVEPYESMSDGVITYMASNGQGVKVMLYFVDEMLSITVTKETEE